MIPLPLTTGRLVLRTMREDDAAAFAGYRSHPEVARYQSWSVPYPEERALEDIRSQLDLPGPVPGEWVQLAVEHEGRLAGDVVVHLDAGGEIATIGYTMDPAVQGRGFAHEAVGALVDALLADGVLRITADCDPRNQPSRRVLERLGFEREGLLRRNYQAPEGWVDDERWGLLPEDRAAWLARPQGRPAEVRLVELGERPRAYGRLSVFPTQEGRVATVWESFADALLPEPDDGGGILEPWLRGIEADGEPAGFVMCSEPTPTSPLPFLWRLLVDRRHQGRGIAELAVSQVIDRYRAMGCEAMLTSWVPGERSAEGFHRRMGFVPTGEVLDDGEVLGRLPLR